MLLEEGGDLLDVKRPFTLPECVAKRLAGWQAAVRFDREGDDRGHIGLSCCLRDTYRLFEMVQRER